MKLRVSCSNYVWALLALMAIVPAAFSQPATIAGQVTETLHGKPIPKVTVSFHRGIARGTPPKLDVYSTVTDSEGRFRIANVIEGRYSVQFTAQGYVWPLRKDGNSEIPQPLLLQEGEEHAVTLRLTPTGVISGRTLDADGDPLRDVSVQLQQYSSASGKRELSTRASAQSNDRGEYRLYNIPPGTYYLLTIVRNRPGGMVLNNEQIRGPRPPQGFLSTYYPNARDAVSSAPLQVSAGEELSHVDIRLLPEMLYTVRVKSPDPPSADTYPMFSLQRRGERNGNFSNSGFYNGGTELRFVPPGSYQLTGMVRSAAINATPQSYTRQTVEVVDRDVEVEVPPFAPLLDLTGVVQVNAAPPFPLQQLHLMLRKDSFDQFTPDPNAVVAADGTFAFHGFIPDLYTLSAQVPAGAYLKAVKLGNRELPDLAIDLSAGAAPLSILLATDGGRIKGSVENRAGEPAARTSVTLYPEGSQRTRQDRVKTVGTNADGRYEFKDIAPGDYRIYAWDSSDLAASRDPDFRKKYEAQSETVEVSAGASLAVALRTVVTEQ